MKMAVQAIIAANDAVNSKVITTGKEVKAVFEEVLKFKTELLENKTKEIIRHLDIMFQLPWVHHFMEVGL